jgi:hypothetical protein
MLPCKLLQKERGIGLTHGDLVEFLRIDENLLDLLGAFLIHVEVGLVDQQTYDGFFVFQFPLTREQVL